MKRLLRAGAAWAAAAALASPAGGAYANMTNPLTPAGEPTLTGAGASGTAGAGSYRDPAAQGTLSVSRKIALLRQKVKYVFVLFQENRSFDHYFGTYPGANGLTGTYPGAKAGDPYAQPASVVHPRGLVIRNVDGSYAYQRPFLLPRSIVRADHATVRIYPEDTYSVDHSHAGYLHDFHADQATRSKPADDGYILDQEGLHYATDASGPDAPIVGAAGVAPSSNPTLQKKQEGEMAVSHVDCDTIPFLWQYADRFVLFDNMHQTATGPSTPNAIAMIAGQVGDTQWVEHPSEADTKRLTLPNLTDSPPFAGSSRDDWTGKPPYGPDEAALARRGGHYAFDPKAGQVNLTFATLPLSFMGGQIGAITQSDQHPGDDLADVRHDVQAIAAHDPQVGWGWYQQGYGPEPFDGGDIHEGAGHLDPAPEHGSYVVHHNAPQYFGYLGDNAAVAQAQAAIAPGQPGNLHGLQQFYADVAGHALPAGGGVFYVRGGYYNNDSLTPLDPNPHVRHAMAGDDDHPNYSDAQISEALIADSVNAIAASPYWADCAIIIAYDESDGLYDHQPEQFRTYGPDGQPETGGPRIPAIVISPFAAAHTVSHMYTEHSGVIKFIDELFGLIPLAGLPDEAAAAAAAAKNPAFDKPDGSPQAHLGPGDGLAAMGDLTEAFDNDRLSGSTPPLPASYATIAAGRVRSLPQDGGAGCAALHVVPTDYAAKGYGPGQESDPPPSDFNPRPAQSPGSPYYDTGDNTVPGSATGTGGPWPN